MRGQEVDVRGMNSPLRRTLSSPYYKLVVCGHMGPPPSLLNMGFLSAFYLRAHIGAHLQCPSLFLIRVGIVLAFGDCGCYGFTNQVPLLNNSINIDNDNNKKSLGWLRTLLPRGMHMLPRSIPMVNKFFVCEICDKNINVYIIEDQIFCTCLSLLKIYSPLPSFLNLLTLKLVILWHMKHS